MAINIVREKFSNFGELISITSARPNNKYMKNKHSSMDEEYDNNGWHGTKNWKTACDMLGTGYLEILKSMKTQIDQQNKLNAKFVESIDRPRPSIGVQGYCPCVPNAIRNLPQSMININRKPQKRKTLHILYSIDGNGNRDTAYFTRAGAALLSAIEIIEKGGIQTKIDLNFMAIVSGNEVIFPTINIKNYGERYSIQKISFPIAHPSMLRRIGFKWLETSPDIQNTYSGYGSAVPYEELEKALDIKDPKTYLINTDWIERNGYSVEKILKKFEVI